MHPSPSVIIFTSLSGLGFGLLVFLGLQMPDVMGAESRSLCESKFNVSDVNSTLLKEMNVFPS